MGHDHHHHHGHHHHHDASGNIKVAFFLNLLFAILEIFGGLWTNSLAILSDALHDLGDSFALGMAWFLEKYSKKQGDARFSYGYRRFSLLAALINTLILIGGGLFVLTEAVPRLINPEPTNATGMMLFAIGGILVNGIAVLRLKGGTSMNEKVVTWHLLEDVLGWVAVLIVSIVMMFKELPILDPVLSIVITLYVLANVIKGLKQTMSLFMQMVPEGLSIRDINDAFRKYKKVKSVHHTHIWSMDSEQHVLTSHIVVEDSSNREDIIEIKKQAKEYAEKKHINHITLEVEYESEQCAMKDAHGKNGICYQPEE